MYKSSDDLIEEAKAANKPQGGWYKKDSSDKAEKTDSSAQKLRDKEEQALQPDDTGSLYSKSASQKEKGGLSRFRSRKKQSSRRGLLGSRRRLAIAGALVGTTGILFSAFFGLLNLQLEHFFQNIDARTFARYNVMFEGRSSKWFDSYLKARLLDVERPGADRDTLYFRSERVDNNNPFTDWYRTMRTSSFEADLLNKHGIQFTSAVKLDANGKITTNGLARITVDGDDVLSIDIKDKVSDWDGFQTALKDGDFKVARSLLNLDDADNIFKVDFFDSNKSARKAIKQAVNNEVPWYRLIKRFSLRRNISNMTGVKKWRFFENTRDKITNSRMRFQLRLMDATFGSLNSNGKFFACLVGGSCPKTSDFSDPKNIASNGTDGKPLQNDAGDADPEQPVDQDGRDFNDASDGDSKNATRDSLSEVRQEILSIDDNDTRSSRFLKKAITSKVLTKVVGVVAIFELTDMMVSIHNNFESENLYKLLEVQRAAEYTGLYASYSIMRDQINAGEELLAEDVGAALASLDGFAASEGWQSVVQKNKADENTKEAACADLVLRESTDFPYLCEDEKLVNSDTADEGNTRLAKLHTSYNNSVGIFMGPIAGLYNGVSSIPLLGTALEWGLNVLQSIGDAVFQTVLNVLNLDESFESAMVWMVEKVGNFFGFGPTIDGSEGGREIGNKLIAGSVAAAENAIRTAGGRETTNDAGATLYYQQLVAEERAIELASLSVFERLFSLNEPSSLATKLATVKQSGVKRIAGSLNFATIGNSLSGFTQVVFAQENTETPAEFSGSREYGFSQSLMDKEPVDLTPAECTNADSLLGISMTWQLVTNTDAFWTEVHAAAEEKYGDDYDSQVRKIENVCLLDAQISAAFTGYYGAIDD